LHFTGRPARPGSSAVHETSVAALGDGPLRSTTTIEQVGKHSAVQQTADVARRSLKGNRAMPRISKPPTKPTATPAMSKGEGREHLAAAPQAEGGR
jgi:hypothetical protein